MARGQARAVRGLLDHGEQPHPPLARWTGEDIHRKGAGEKFRPRALAIGIRVRPGSALAGVSSFGGKDGAMYGLHRLADASSAETGLGESKPWAGSV